MRDSREILKDVATRLGNGDVDGAHRVISKLVDAQHTSPAEAHRARMTEIGDDPMAFAEYLGELGMSKRELAHHLGHDPSEDELASYNHGRALRRLEARALELASARAEGKIQEWMDR